MGGIQTTGNAQVIQTTANTESNKIEKTLPIVTQNVKNTSTQDTSSGSAARYSQLPPIESKVGGEGILTAIVASMDKMSSARDLPAVRVVKFDGSPEK